MKMEIPTNPEAIEDFIGAIEDSIDDVHDQGMILSQICYDSHNQQLDIFNSSGCIDKFGHFATHFLRPDQIDPHLAAFEYMLIEFEITRMLEGMEHNKVQFFTALISKESYDLTADLRDYYSDEIFEHSIEYNDGFMLLLLTDSVYFKLITKQTE